MGITTTVEQPTKWVNPVVVVRKPNGDVPICLDPVGKERTLPLKNGGRGSCKYVRSKSFLNP